ncbi:MAG: GNAT family N-acetyltransferase [Acidobacteria bacterium]|nr:GNAT family N-acetyltransferase [Acidobacteriota bacterium]
MAVATEFQGMGIANHLMQRSIKYAKASGTPLIFSNRTMLHPTSLALYRKFGFVEVPTELNSEYTPSTRHSHGAFTRSTSILKRTILCILAFAKCIHR